jgi:hypothetical protein
MSTNPFGPLTPEEFQSAVDAPYGRAADILRQHDPMWGKFPGDGEKVKWKVRLYQQVTMQSVTYVEAATEEEAEALAAQIDTGALTFDTFIDADDGEIVDVVPA